MESYWQKVDSIDDIKQGTILLRINNNLKSVFVPIQQYFRIGKYKERRNIERVCYEKFKIIVDAGSNYIGRGVKSTLFTAKQVATALKKAYPEYEFIPLAGRGAFGVEQSY